MIGPRWVLCALWCLLAVGSAFAPINYAPLSVSRGLSTSNIAFTRGHSRHCAFPFEGAREALWGRQANKRGGNGGAKKFKAISSRVKQIVLMISLPFILAVRRVSAKELKAVASQKGSSRLLKDIQHSDSSSSLAKLRRKARVEILSDSASVTHKGVRHHKSKNDNEHSNYEDIKTAIHDTEMEVTRTWRSLWSSLEGTKLDALILLLATSVVIPLFKVLRKSSILGFLLTGTILGPNGLNIFTDIHRIDLLGELGVVFFLFEMGLDLSLERLKAMRKDVFGLGTTTFLTTTLMGTGIAQACGLSMAASIALSSSLSLASTGSGPL